MLLRPRVALDEVDRLIGLTSASTSLAGGRVGRSGLVRPTTNIVHGAGPTEDWIKLLADTGGFRRSNAQANSPLALSFCPANGTKMHRPFRATVMTQPLRLTPYPD